MLNFVLLFCFILVCIGVHLSRNNKNSNATFNTLVFAIVIWTVASLTQQSLSEVWSNFTSLFSLKNILLYVGIGVLYSFFEFWYQILTDRKAAKKCFDNYKVVEKHDDDTPSYKKYNPYTDANSRMRLVTYVGDNKYSPTIDRSEAFYFMLTVTAYWPAYIVELMLGRFMRLVIEVITNLTANINQKIVNRLFKDIG